MTIPEVQRRISENMVLLGPVVGRFTQEVLSPIIFRVFDILYAAGEIPLPPMSVQGQDLDIVYISTLARAQRESEVFSLQAFMQDTGMVATAFPEALDKLSGDVMINDLAKIRGINPEVLRSDSEVAQIRKQRAEMQAQAAKMQQIKDVAEIAETGSSAEANLRPEATE